MKTWKKIGIGLLVIFAGVVVYFYIVGSGTSPPSDDADTQENPIFPFESSDDDEFFGESSSDSNDSDSSSNQPQEDPSGLWKISDRPVAGSQWVKPDNQPEQIWYVRKENGHVYKTDPTGRELVRLTNKTIPRVQEALISPQGNYIIYRYLDEETSTTKTYLANLSDSEDDQAPYRIGGEFLPDDITTVSLSPDGEKAFYLQLRNNDVLGVIHDISEGSDRVVFQSRAKEWRSRWSTINEITLFTKPDRSSTGFAYRVNSNTGELRKIAEGDGLIANLSPNNEYILTSSFENGQYKGRLKTTDNQQTTLMSPQTMADKCGWTKDQGVLLCAIPDNFPRRPVKDWYQGKTSFNDTLTLFNPVSRDNRVLFTYDELDEGPFDIIDIKSDTSLNTLIFRNKKTGILWGYEL